MIKSNGVPSEIKWKSKEEIRKEYDENHIKSGCLKNIDGNWCPQKFPDEIWEKRKQAILNCGVDLKTFGWKAKVQKATGLTRKQVNLTVERFNIDVYKRMSV